eukprot:4601169-Amphidinium_carterae.2
MREQTNGGHRVATTLSRPGSAVLPRPLLTIQNHEALLSHPLLYLEAKGWDYFTAPAFGAGFGNFCPAHHPPLSVWEQQFVCSARIEGHCAPGDAQG